MEGQEKRYKSKELRASPTLHTNFYTNKEHPFYIILSLLYYIIFFYLIKQILFFHILPYSILKLLTYPFTSPFLYRKGKNIKRLFFFLKKKIM